MRRPKTVGRLEGVTNAVGNDWRLLRDGVFAFVGAAGNLSPKKGTLGIDLDGLGAGAGAGGGDSNCGVPFDFSSCSTSNPSTPEPRLQPANAKHSVAGERQHLTSEWVDVRELAPL